MARAPDGGQAFPTPAMKGPRSFEDNEPAEPGMTLRDYFAASALVGTLAGRLHGTGTPKSMAEFSYRCADAMIAARAKPEEAPRDSAPAGELDLVAVQEAALGDRLGGTGIKVRARFPAGGYGTVDIRDLEPPSLLAWLRSRGGRNPLAENTVGMLLGYGQIVPAE